MEARLGRAPRKLAVWVAQHRRSLRAAGRGTVKGAKVLWYRKDRQGYLWMPLTYQIAASEQLPGAAYPPNVSVAVHYPLPLAEGKKAEVLWSVEARLSLQDHPITSFLCSPGKLAPRSRPLKSRPLQRGRREGLT